MIQLYETKHFQNSKLTESSMFSLPSCILYHTLPGLRHEIKLVTRCNKNIFIIRHDIT